MERARDPGGDRETPAPEEPRREQSQQRRDQSQPAAAPTALSSAMLSGCPESREREKKA